MSSDVVAAVIPARGGSKGIPRKNLQRVGARTLVARSVEAARSARWVHRVSVSTDDDEIAAEAARHGAEVLRRPSDLAGDTASSESALLHALDVMDIHDGVLVFLQCTSPFTRGEDIDRVVAPVASGQVASAFAAVDFHGFLWRPGTSGATGVNHDERQPRQRRQDRSVELLETGAVYAMDVAQFRAVGSRFVGQPLAVEFDVRRGLEIDDIHELEVARALAPLLDQSPNGLRRPAVIGLDFDGVLTDDRVSVDQDGTESVRCHRGDGHAIARLRQHVDVVVFSTEANPVVSARCRKLGIEAVQGLGFGKAKAVRTWARDRGVPLDDVLFVGNDVNDLETFGTVGIAVAVADAVPSVRRAADVVLTTRGGSGAIRELADLLLPLFNATQEGDTTS